jgi:hypothetical protein
LRRCLCARFVDTASTFPALRGLCARFVDAASTFLALKMRHHASTGGHLAVEDFLQEDEKAGRFLGF